MGDFATFVKQDNRLNKVTLTTSSLGKGVSFEVFISY